MRPTITLLFIVILCFCMPGKGQQAQDRAIPEQEVAPNRTVILPWGGREIVGVNAPVILLWQEPGRGINSVPTLYLALWEDGTIIWNRGDDRNMVFGGEHFQAKIPEKQVEDFLSAFDKTGFREFSGRSGPIPVSARFTFFLLGTENTQFRFTMGSVRWHNQERPMSEVTREMAAKWRATLDLLLALIPEKGEQISLSIERNLDKRQWEVTPVPLREADRAGAAPNVRDNTSNWGSPVRQ